MADGLEDGSLFGTFSQIVLEVVARATTHRHAVLVHHADHGLLHAGRVH